ncbi:MAG: hypothetical protein IJL10_05190 [Synergistaceae bacterium]|nr:hypothetical protein [Synergistaceae bacterium]
MELGNIFGDSKKIAEDIQKRIDSLEETLTELLKHALSSEQQMSAQNLSEIKQAIETHKKAAQDIVVLLGAIQQRNDELNAAGIRSDLANEHLKTASENIDRLNADLAEREARVELREKDIKQSDANIKTREEALRKRESAMIDRETKVAEREIAVKQKEDEAVKTIQEAQLKALQSDIAKARTSAFEQLAHEIEKERTARLQEISTERESLVREQQELRQEQAKLLAERKENEQQNEELVFDRESIKNEKANLKKRAASLEQTAEEEAQRRSIALQTENDSQKAIIEGLRQNLEEARTALADYEVYMAASGGQSPQAILSEKNKLKQDIEALRKELATRPDSSIISELQNVKDSLKTAKDDKLRAEKERDELIEENSKTRSLELQKMRLEEENQNLHSRVDEQTREIEMLMERLKRLSSEEGHKVEREQRIADIKQGCPELEGVEDPCDSLEGQPEMGIAGESKWLEEMWDSFSECGFKVSRRLLYAFHTALKIADWSIITVLAGVSGTGKSKLPQIYSAIGRLNFKSVPVQPNWDSQESMLGYFNSIDNRFDSQPVLRFLAEVTDRLDNCMNIVLLDEMNLAHVEYYFAEFLSKLEMRRDLPNGEEPPIEVKLGAGEKPYYIPLLRTILWVGTMNQDETTKSLSDKVLDRGIVINFPRPKKLVGRSNLVSINDFISEKGIASRPMLHYEVWRSWIKQDTSYFSDKQKKAITECRDIVEEINNYLGKAGRALGHRVWQSIEFYIANHPDVIFQQSVSQEELTDGLKKAIKSAFEDQLVQKVMPKLRGIEVRGQDAKECLDPIKSLLNKENFTIERDFDNACRLGYGQFIWSTAEYLEE